MKNYLNFEADIKKIELELDQLKDPYNESLTEVDTAKITKLTRGNNIDLKSIELGSIATKNIDLNLSNTLQINAPILLDKIGDKAFLNLKINSTNPKNAINNLVVVDIGFLLLN